jgi:hypothetical protein
MTTAMDELLLLSARISRTYQGRITAEQARAELHLIHARAVASIRRTAELRDELIKAQSVLREFGNRQRHIPQLNRDIKAGCSELDSLIAQMNLLTFFTEDRVVETRDIEQAIELRMSLKKHSQLSSERSQATESDSIT